MKQKFPRQTKQNSYGSLCAEITRYEYGIVSIGEIMAEHYTTAKLTSTHCETPATAVSNLNLTSRITKTI